MIVSKASWHYRLYIDTMTVWAPESHPVNEKPNLCSYMLAIGLLAPANALGKVINKIDAFCFKNKVRGCTTSTIALVALVAICAHINAATTGNIWWVEFSAAMMKVGVGLGVIAFFGLFLLSVVLILMGIEVAVKSANHSVKGSSFIKLATTWAHDKWDGTFCRSLTFVD